MTGVLGLDLSLSRSGVALADGNLRSIAPSIKVTKQDDPTQSARRLHEIIGRLDGCLRHRRPTLAVIEGYNPGGHQGFTASRLGEIGGAVRIRLFELGIVYFEVAPTQLKLWATGKGNASKDEMVAAAQEAGIEPANHDEADAYWLRHMGKTAVDGGLLNEHRAQILGRLDWRLP